MFGFGKGKIELTLSKFSFSPGENIEGTLHLELKKPLEARGLNVGLIGEQRTRQYSAGRSSSNNTLVFDFKQPLDGAKTYPQGRSADYPFSIKISQDLFARGAIPGGALGTVVKFAQAMSGTMASVKWFVTANLDVKGFDVSKRVQINIG